MCSSLSLWDSSASRLGHVTSVFCHCSRDTTTADNTSQLLYHMPAPPPGSLASVVSVASAALQGCFGSHCSRCLQNTGLVCFRTGSGSGLKTRFHSYMKLCLLRLIWLQDILTIRYGGLGKKKVLGTTLKPDIVLQPAAPKGHRALISAVLLLCKSSL